MIVLFGIVMIILTFYLLLSIIGIIVLPIVGTVMLIGFFIALVGIAFKVMFSIPFLIVIIILYILYTKRK
ncbi:hypothetical protein ACJDU8_04710 [Clostridium sp. WILCCON 0269]|uniref:ABC transmembrane type-1 domain-containing protein n=1 Tax=Candidatus Clostridium eludens TaxID=3381663 RepID=A0ABW8SFR1_9CLOT